MNVDVRWYRINCVYKTMLASCGNVWYIAVCKYRLGVPVRSVTQNKVSFMWTFRICWKWGI